MLIAVFTPTGKRLYDVAIPAGVMALASMLLAVSGVISENAGLWCFAVGALIHVFLLWLVRFLMQGK